MSFRSTIVLLVLMLALPACGGYTLRGKVIRGDFNDIQLVHETDPRVHAMAPGLLNAEILVKRDPNTLNTKLVGRTRSGSDGNFSLSISEFGAGWMDEQWLVQAVLSGYQNTETVLKLPSSRKWRLLIIMSPGTSTPSDTSRDFMEDFQQFR